MIRDECTAWKRTSGGSAPPAPAGGQDPPRAGVDRLDVCPPWALGISFSLGNFTLSPGSLREEAGAQPIPSRSGPRPDGGDGRVQILQALQRLAGEMWGPEKAGQTELGRAESPHRAGEGRGT